METPDDTASISAYHVGAWHAGGVQHGPQCSADGEFCFFCAFRESGETGDVCADLKAMVRIMVGQRKELSVIVDALSVAYTTDLQAEVTYTNPTGVVVRAPAWSHNSIQKHLVFSTEFAGLFENIVTHIHQSIIMHLNAKMVRPNGEVAEDSRKALVDTVASLQRWQRNKPK